MRLLLGLLAVLLLSLGLTACGGGGGGSTTERSELIWGQGNWDQKNWQ